MTESFDDKARTWDDDPKRIARANAVAEGIRAQVPLSRQMTGFEYGCGTGLLSFALLPHLKHIVLADSSGGMLAVLRGKIASQDIPNMEAIKLDLAADPLPDGQFSIVYTMMTLHHIVETDLILRHFHALLEPSGHLCIADLDQEDGSFHGPDFHGHKGFDRKTLARDARNAGFHNIEFSTIFEIRKGDGQEETTYPVFLMVAEKT